MFLDIMCCEPWRRTGRSARVIRWSRQKGEEEIIALEGRRSSKTTTNTLWKNFEVIKMSAEGNGVGVDYGSSGSRKELNGCWVQR